MANTPRTISKSHVRARWAPSVSDATLTRVTAALLWVLIGLAALGGITALTRSSSSGESDGAPATALADQSEARFVASGFAERYVTAYLQAGSDGASLASFLGYQPELPPTAQATTVTAAVRTVEVTEAADGYWAVTVAVGGPGEERFWRAAVQLDDELVPIAIGLPSAVAGPATVKRVPLGVTMAQPPADDPLVETFTGFLSAYLCGQGDLSRYLRPGTALRAADPAVCREIEIKRWGAKSVDDDHQTVVVDAQLGSGANARIATYSAALTRRDGRWEIAELLPAPPRESDEN